MSANNVTAHRWEIANFHKQYSDSYYKTEPLSSATFALKTRTSVAFALTFDSKIGDLHGDLFGIQLKQIDEGKSVVVDIKFCLKNDEGQKFAEHLFQKQVFNTIGNQLKVSIEKGTKSHQLLEKVFSDQKPLIVCCDLLEICVQPVVNYNPKLLQSRWIQSQWAAFEREKHDAIIKVGQKEFKVFKHFFTIHSEVFASMFGSSFKEGLTSIVEIDDVTEKTMLQLIRWLYIGQIEDNDNFEDLFVVADKYDIKLLKEICAHHLFSDLNKDNAVKRLILAVLHNNDSLKEAALKRISGMTTVEITNMFTSPELINLYQKNFAVASEISYLIRGKMVKL